MTTTLDLLGAACLVAAAYLVALPLGLACAGVLFLAASAKASG